MKHRWTFRNGRIVRCEAFATTEEARDALGLSEPGPYDVEIAGEFLPPAEPSSRRR
jgi:hypothetical protein